MATWHSLAVGLLLELSVAPVGGLLHARRKHANCVSGGKKQNQTANATTGSNTSLRSHPFDCYVENGADYVGLMDFTRSGRKCKGWLDEGTGMGKDYTPATEGIGSNHHYCRNPEGERDMPWCYTVDPEVEWEYCEVPQCPEGSSEPEPWKAPKGSKSEEAEAEGPCEYEPPDKPNFEEYEAGRACMANRGKTWWLIGMENTTEADPEGCERHCSEKPGTKYFTFFTGASEGNCGCYRQCILVPEDETENDPTVYKVV
jgi:hypothetical protein